jgi:hypothetical protein
MKCGEKRFNLWERNFAMLIMQGDIMIPSDWAERNDHFHPRGMKERASEREMKAKKKFHFLPYFKNSFWMEFLSPFNLTMKLAGNKERERQVFRGKWHLCNDSFICFSLLNAEIKLRS